MPQVRRRFLYIYFPRWSINRIKRVLHVCRPIALTHGKAQQERVKFCCQQAHCAGVRAQMPVQLARALCPELWSSSWDARADVKALYEFSLKMVRFTPLFGLDLELVTAWQKKDLVFFDSLSWGVVLDLTGTQKVNKSEAALIKFIDRCVGKANIEVRIAVASSLGAAWGLARFHPETTVIVQEQSALKSAIEKLPIEALRLTYATVASLRLLGIQYVGELFKLPTKQLASRFGIALLKRIDQALGVVDDSFYIIQQPSTVRVELLFEVPILEQASLAVALLTAFKDLFEKLLQEKKVASLFRIELLGLSKEFDSEIHVREVSLNSATRSFKHIQTVLTPIIERLIIPRGVTKISIKACYLAGHQEEQINYLSSSDLAFLINEGRELINVLASRLGQVNLKAAHFMESHIPERSFAYSPIATNYVARPTVVTNSFTQPQGRPSSILQRPQPINAIAMLPDKAPVRLYWQGQILKVLQAIGPERIQAEWWQEALHELNERDYFKVQDHTGRWLWVFRDRQSMAWFLQGVWN